MCTTDSAHTYALLLIKESRESYGVDPYTLMALAMGREDLCTLDWGKKLYDMARRIMGDRGYVFRQVIAAVQAIFLDADIERIGYGGAGAMVRRYLKSEVVSELTALGGSDSVSCPVLFQFMNIRGKRRHVGFRNPRDAILCYMRLLQDHRGIGMEEECLQLVECPIPQIGGLIKFYVDVDCKFSVLQGCGVRSIEDARDILLEMPATLGRIFVDIGVISSREEFCVLVKENSRALPSGDHKLSFHFITQLLLTVEMFVYMQRRIRCHLQKECHRCVNLQHGMGGDMVAKDLVTMGRYACMAFADSHSETNAKQGLAGPWCRKSVDLPQVSTLRGFVWICNGQMVRQEACDPDIFIPVGGVTLHATHLDPVKAVRALADALIGVPGPRCKSFIEGCMLESILPPPGKRRLASCNPGVGGTPRTPNQGGTPRTPNHSAMDWGLMPTWFSEQCALLCQGTLPVVIPLQNHIGYPCGVGGSVTMFQVCTTPLGFDCRGGMLVGWIVLIRVLPQVNSSPLSICPRSMMCKGGVTKGCHWHKNNGTVFMGCNDRVFAVCRDAVCERVSGPMLSRSVQ
jgi:hypothetical protein